MLLCRSCDVVGSGIRAERALHVELCELLIDSIRSLLVSEKRTQLLTKYNTGDEEVQYLRISQHGSGKC